MGKIQIAPISKDYLKMQNNKILLVEQTSRVIDNILQDVSMPGHLLLYPQTKYNHLHIYANGFYYSAFGDEMAKRATINERWFNGKYDEGVNTVAFIPKNERTGEGCLFVLLFFVFDRDLFAQDYGDNKAARMTAKMRDIYNNDLYNPYFVGSRIKEEYQTSKGWDSKNGSLTIWLPFLMEHILIDKPWFIDNNVDFLCNNIRDVVNIFADKCKTAYVFV